MEQEIKTAYREFLMFGAKYEIEKEKVVVVYFKCESLPSKIRTTLVPYLDFCNDAWINFCKNYVIERK